MLRGEIIPLQCRGVMSSCGWGPRIYATPYPGVAGSEQTRRLQYKNTNFLVLLLLLLILSRRYDRKCWEKHLPCWLPGGNAIKPVNLKVVAKYMLLQAPSNLKNRRLQGQDSRTGMVWVVRVIQGVQVVQVVSVVKVVGDVRAIQVV